MYLDGLVNAQYEQLNKTQTHALACLSLQLKGSCKFLSFKSFL